MMVVVPHVVVMVQLRSDTCSSKFCRMQPACAISTPDTCRLKMLQGGGVGGVGCWVLVLG
jgi:hypothetical protein